MYTVRVSDLCYCLITRETTFTNQYEFAEVDIEHYAEEHWLPHLRHQVCAIL